MTRVLLSLAILAAACAAQPAAAAHPAERGEEEHLRRAVTESTSSPVDLIRSLESHLAKYPDSARRLEIERALAQAAIETRDDPRIARYGERVLAREPDDLVMLDRVTRALLSAGDAAGAKRALGYARRYEELLRAILAKPAASAAETASRKEEVERAIGRALLSQAIATGAIGDAAGAAALARKSFDTAPGPDAAAEIGRRLAQLGRIDDAVAAYADAFSLSDAGVTNQERAEIRKRLGDLFRKAKGSEDGLGDVVLKAYDRNVALVAARKAELRAIDPNAGLTDPMSFTLTGVDGRKLELASLRGKAVVLDFWATWCGPCRTQHPLYEEVKKRFAGRDDVVFLAINTDEEREPVKPFLAEQGWSSSRVYFADGLSRLLRVSSIPTTVIFARNGAVASRMNGFDPARFVDMLTERIHEALK
jgi:thiol-disulfide isomerase/thioredoxin